LRLGKLHPSTRAQPHRQNPLNSAFAAHLAGGVFIGILLIQELGYFDSDLE